MKSRNVFLILFVVYVAFMLAAIVRPAHAQDATPTAGDSVITVITPAPNDSGVNADTPAPSEPPVFNAPNPDEVANAAFIALLAAFSTGILSPLTVVIVSLVKRIKLGFIQAASGDQINLAVAILLSLVMWGANRLGYGPQISTGYKLLYAVLPILMGIGGSYLTTQAAYNSVRGKMPVVGYARTKGTPLTALEKAQKTEIERLRGKQVNGYELPDEFTEAMIEALKGPRG